MTEAVVTVNEQGRVTIPLELRRELGIEPGTRLVVYVEDGRLIAESESTRLRRLQRTLAQARQAATSDTTTREEQS
jgi:AbrB family looped-hinge helix DNA binding protein